MGCCGQDFGVGRETNGSNGRDVVDATRDLIINYEDAVDAIIYINWDSFSFLFFFLVGRMEQFFSTSSHYLAN